MRFARKLASALGILVIIAVAGLVVAFGFLQSPPGKRMLASVASSLASGGGLTVSIEDISGFVPSNLRIGRIAVADPQGQFAEIDGLAVSWSPLALLSGTVNVEALTADRVAIDRRPVLPAG